MEYIYKSGLMDNAIKAIDEGKKVLMYNEADGSKNLKPYFIKDLLKSLIKVNNGKRRKNGLHKIARNNKR